MLQGHPSGDSHGDGAQYLSGALIDRGASDDSPILRCHQDFYKTRRAIGQARLEGGAEVGPIDLDSPSLRKRLRLVEPT